MMLEQGHARAAAAMLSLDAARERLLAGARPVAEVECVPLHAAVGRVLAGAVVSAIDVPPCDNSAMDGYALRCADVAAAGTCLTVAQRIAAGCIGVALAPGTAARIFTGAPLPPGADAVVMQERCARADDSVVVNHVPTPGENIRRKGEGIAGGALVLPRGRRLTAQAIGLAASVGAADLSVFRRLSVGVLSTGDELAPPGAPLPAGGIYNSNRAMLCALLQRLGCMVFDHGNLPDALDATRSALLQAAAVRDLVVTTGGVSVGEEDHVRAAVEAVGKLMLWNVAVKPGKPFACGKIGDADFVGLPGNPVSAFVSFLLLVRPFILKRQGAHDLTPQALTLSADFAWPQPGARREFLRGRVGAGGAVELFPNQSSGVLASTLWADGLVDNPPHQAIRRGDVVRYLPFSELLD